MICREMVERLLDAEPAELAGRGGGAVAAHVRTCARCRAAAERLLAGQAALAAELSAAPRLDADEAIEKVLAGAAGQAPTTAGGGVRRGRRVLRALAPLAAAAAVALLLVRHDVPSPAFEGGAGSRAVMPSPPAALPTVIAPAGRNAALFRTSDPRITVVWIY